MKWVYVVWFDDPYLSKKFPDSDEEWVACFVIVSDTSERAKRWGDYLSNRYAQDANQEFLRSFVEPYDQSDLPKLDTLPVVVEGQDVDNDYIGW